MLRRHIGERGEGKSSNQRLRVWDIERFVSTLAQSARQVFENGRVFVENPNERSHGLILDGH